MVKDQEYCRTGELAGEILMYITTSIFLVIFILVVWVFLVLYIFSKTIGNRFISRNRIVSDKNVSLFLSSAYGLFVPVMSYLFSQAKEYNPEGRAKLILIWMLLIEFLRIVCDPLITWGLWKWVDQLLQLLWVGYLAFSSLTLKEIWDISFLYLYVASFVVRRGTIFNKAKDSYLIGNNPKLIHSNVKRIMLRHDLQTTPMDHCDYIVMGEENHEITHSSNGYTLGNQKPNSVGLLTIKRLFQHNSPNDRMFTLAHPDWRDSCLSLALAKMMRRRFAKLPLDEAGRKKALDFVVNGLINGTDGQRNPVEWVFSIIQEELMFVSDFLHIRAPALFYFPDYFHDCILKVVYFVAWLNLFLVSRPPEAQDQDCLLQVSRNSTVVVNIFSHFDKVITSSLFFISMYMPIYQLLNDTLMTTRWANFRSVRSYINDRPSPTENRRYSSSVIVMLKRTCSRLGNYIMNVLRRRRQTRVYDSSIFDLEAETFFFCIKLNDSNLAPFPKWIRRNIPRSPPTVFHSTDALEAILESLKKSAGRVRSGEIKFDQESLLTNGETSLQKYEMENLNWANLRICSTTQAILVWHIATTLFHHHESSPQQNNDPLEEPTNNQNNNSLKKEQEVAIALSSYCHYLVKYLPELLPDDVDWIQDNYETVMKEISAIALFFFQKPTKGDRCNYAIHAELSEILVLGKGAKVAHELIKFAEQGKEVWKMLAEFWAEMLLFIAPSDNVDRHEKILERGKLITQLWTLLTHAGIITRPKPTEPDNHERENNAVPENMHI